MGQFRRSTPRPPEFHTQNKRRSRCFHRLLFLLSEENKPAQGLTGQRKSLPLGAVPRAAKKKLYDCRWQSYLYYGVTDEVEGRNAVPTCGENRQLRPHQSALAGCQLLLQEKPSAPPAGFCVWNLSGRGMPPPLQCLARGRYPLIRSPFRTASTSFSPS